MAYTVPDRFRHEYYNVKNQVLLQDPLSSINKAYSMVMSKGKHNEV